MKKILLALALAASILLCGCSEADKANRSTKKRPTLSCKAFFGAPSGTRTQDPLIKSQLLYQLS